MSAGAYGLRALGRYARAGTRARERGREGERCDVCRTVISESHAHVVDRDHRTLLCACRPCALTFMDNPRGRFRAVPDEVKRIEEGVLSVGELQGLGVPVALALLVRSSVLERWLALFPSPAGLTEAELSHAASAALDAGIIANAAEDDVEVLLVRTTRDGQLIAFVAPIDLGYRLGALLRTSWKGLDGGEQARRVVDRFFDDLAARAAIPREPP